MKEKHSCNVPKLSDSNAQKRSQKFENKKHPPTVPS